MVLRCGSLSYEPQLSKYCSLRLLLGMKSSLPHFWSSNFHHVFSIPLNYTYSIFFLFCQPTIAYWLPLSLAQPKRCLSTISELLLVVPKATCSLYSTKASKPIPSLSCSPCSSLPQSPLHPNLQYLLAQS